MLASGDQAKEPGLWKATRACIHQSYLLFLQSLLVIVTPIEEVSLSVQACHARGRAGMYRGPPPGNCLGLRGDVCKSVHMLGLGLVLKPCSNYEATKLLFVATVTDINL